MTRGAARGRRRFFCEGGGGGGQEGGCQGGVLDMAAAPAAPPAQANKKVEIQTVWTEASGTAVDLVCIV